MTDTISIGIEEEYLLVNPERRELALHQPPGFMECCKELLGSRVTYEMLQSQVEIGSDVCQTIDTRLISMRPTIAASLGGTSILVSF